MLETAPRVAALDPLIDEIRQYRAQLDRQFAGDWSAYGEFIRQSAGKIREEFRFPAAQDDAKAGSQAKKQ
jgi:hypothetical protein